MDRVNIDGIILAAGLSTRFGRPKQLADWRGRPLVLHATETALASRLGTVIVVIGHAAERVRAALNPVAGNSRLRLTINPEYEEGRASSIRCGLDALTPGAHGAMFLACDQPLITPGLIDALIETFARHRPLICYPVAGAARSNPTIFSAELFPELMCLTGDVGGSALIGKYKSRVREHKLPSLRSLEDVDREEDMESLP